MGRPHKKGASRIALIEGGFQICPRIQPAHAKADKVHLISPRLAAGLCNHVPEFLCVGVERMRGMNPCGVIHRESILAQPTRQMPELAILQEVAFRTAPPMHQHYGEPFSAWYGDRPQYGDAPRL